MKKGDEILLSVMEHHSNIVPWQLLQKDGIRLKYVDILSDGTLNMKQFEDLITEKTKLVSVTGASNVLGTINPLKEIGKMAHDSGALFVVDGAQSVPHMPTDVRDIDCDFLVASGHKMLGPTGIGFLYGKYKLLENMEPFLRGSDEIKEVKLHETEFQDPPYRFEAGTPNIADTIALGTAIDYLLNIGMKNIREHEKELVKYALERLSEIKGIKIYGPMDPKIRAGVISFNLADIHSHDLATILDNEGIAIRSGHHCTQPLMERLGIISAARASFYIYNDESDVDALVNGLEKAKKIFKV